MRAHSLTNIDVCLTVASIQIITNKFHVLHTYFLLLLGYTSLFEKYHSDCDCFGALMPQCIILTVSLQQMYVL